MKKIIVLIASVCFMASSAFANVGTLSRVTTAVETAKVQVPNLAGINAAAVSVTVANQPNLQTALDKMADDIEAVVADASDDVNGLTKVERVKFLANQYTAAILTPEKYGDVASLFTGQVYASVMGTAAADKVLSSSEVDKYSQILNSYVTALNAGELTADAMKKAVDEVIPGKTVADLIDACGSGALRD